MLLSEFCFIGVHFTNVNSLRIRGYCMAQILQFILYIYDLTSILCGECTFNVPWTSRVCSFVLALAVALFCSD